MQLKKEEQQDKENGMYYTPKIDHPFDPLSQQQMEVFGGIFSKESNADALQKNSPIYISKPYVAPKINYLTVEEPQPNSSPIRPLPFGPLPFGPLSFLRTTVPQTPDSTFVDFLNKI